jgi:hypothetical protein
MEINPGGTQATVECQELQMEEADVDAVGWSEDRYGDRRLVVRRRRGAKKRTPDSVASRQKSSTARKRVIRRAIPAMRKGHMRKSPGKNSVAIGASRRKMLDKRQRNNSECEDGRVGRDLKKRLSLRMRRTSDRCYRKSIKLEMANLIFVSTTGVQGAKDWTFWLEAAVTRQP